MFLWCEKVKHVPGVGVAHDVRVGRGVAHQQAQAPQEDTLELLTKDAVDHKVH